MKVVKTVFTVVALIGVYDLQAKPDNRVSRDCRREIVKACGLTFDKNKLRECLIVKLSKLSDACRSEVVERAGAKAQLVAGTRTLSYGSDPKQALDFVASSVAGRAVPVIVFIHGGGWSVGDKGASAGAKAAHFTGLGYAFASLNYRLVPQATVEQQAADIASALGCLRSRARELGIDPDRIVLMGHSAGAHLAALTAADPGYFKSAGVPMTSVRGVVLLDGAAYDVARQMAEPENRVGTKYQAAFGTDPERQAALSPLTHAPAPNATDWLILPVADRADSSAQSRDFAAALRTGGSRVTVTPVPDSTHMQLNNNLGTANDFATTAVDAFVATVTKQRAADLRYVIKLSG